MQLPAALLASTVLLAPISAQILPRQSSDPQATYLDSVCSPPTPSGGAVAPCIEITNIETACQPNGTDPLDYVAHAECMCGGSFFPDWMGCLNCLYIHGGRSGAVSSAFSVIISSASNELCTGTPTAPFASIFNSLSDAVAPTGTATVTSDRAPSNAAISLYYTATGSEGPGPITGQATAAVAQSTGSAGGASAPASSAPSATGNSASGASQSSSTGSSGSSGSAGAATTTSSSKGGAAPTHVVGGILGAIVLGAVAVAL